MGSTAAARVVLEAKGVARSRDLEEAGTSRTQIRRLVQQGIIVRGGARDRSGDGRGYHAAARSEPR